MRGMLVGMDGYSMIGDTVSVTGRLYDRPVVMGGVMGGMLVVMGKYGLFFFTIPASSPTLILTNPDARANTLQINPSNNLILTFQLNSITTDNLTQLSARLEIEEVKTINGTIAEGGQSGEILIYSLDLNLEPHVYELTVVYSTGNGVLNMVLLLYDLSDLLLIIPEGDLHSVAPQSIAFLFATEGNNRYKNPTSVGIEIEEISNGDVITLFKLYEIDSIGTKDRVKLVALKENRPNTTWVVTTKIFGLVGNSFLVKNPVNTEENSTIKFVANAASKFPMGRVKMVTKYFDGTSNQVISKINKTNPYIENKPKKYQVQGNYTSTVVLTSSINSLTFNLTIMVWDSLDLLRCDASPIQVGELANFVFKNNPISGFLFKIDYVIGSFKELNRTVLFANFDPPIIQQQYTIANEYNIVLMAWNDYYTRNYTSKLHVQHPITNLTITPTHLVIPFTDTEVNFTITMLNNAPSPTDAVCTISLFEYPDETFPLAIDYNSPLEYVYDFKSPGEYNVQVKCWNRVSNTSFSINIIVRSFTSNDVEIVYQDIISSNFSYPASNVFQLKIFDIQTIPTGVDLFWNFGDGSPIESEVMTKFFKFHEFPKRGNYTILLKVVFSGLTRTITFQQRVGIIMFTISSRLVLNHVDVTLTPYSQDIGLYLEPVEFEMNYNDGSIWTPSRVHAYDEYGHYNPVIKAFNSTLTEFRQLEEYIQVEHAITVLNLKHRAIQEYPPGILDLQITLPPGSLYLPYINCQIKYGDDIDKQLYRLSGNLTTTSPLRTSYQYLTLGKHKINMFCENLLTNLTVESDVVIQNKCFSENGIFDRQYAYKDSPMRSYTSRLLQLTNRMTVNCFKNKQVYTWSMYQLENGTELEIELIQPGRDFIEFPKNSVGIGLYRLMMNASFDDLQYRWFVESTYVEYTNPPLRAEIAGGNVRVNGQTDVEINAELSYDPLFVSFNGLNDALEFAWECGRIESDSPEKIEALYHNQSEIIDCNNISTILSDGLLLFRGSDVSEVTGYYFKVLVTKPERKASSFLQMIQVTSGAPEMNLFCVINCETKTAITSVLSLQSICNNCIDGELETATYTWKIFEYNNVTLEYTQISDIKNMVENTGDNPSTLVIKKGVLNVDKMYRIDVICTIPGRHGRGLAGYSILTNLPPYDGNCMVNPSSGIATKTKFRVICEHWKDEGFRRYRSENLDQNEPLTYKYFIKKDDLVNPLVSGVESTTPEINVPVFPGLNGTDYIILVEIFDILQDFATVYLPIELISPFDTMKDLSEVEKINRLINENEQNLKVVNLTGSSAKFTREVNSVVSVLQTVDIPEEEYLFTKSLAGDEQELSWADIWKDLETPRDKTTSNRVADSGESYMDTLLKRKEDVKSLNGQGVAALAQSLTNLVYKPSTTKLNTAISGSKMALETANRLRDIIRTRPFPIKDDIKGAISSVTDFIDHLMIASVPDLKGRVSDVNEDTIRDQVKTNKIVGQQIGEDEATFIALRLAKSETYEIEQKKSTSRFMIETLESSLDQSHDVLSAMLVKDQDPLKIQKKNMLLQNQKLDPNKLGTNGFESGDFQLKFPNINSTMGNSTNTLNIQTTLFKKNPYTWGQNDSSYGIDSPVLMVNLKDSNNSLLKTNLDLVINKNTDVNFKLVLGEAVTKDADGNHFHAAKLKNARDAIYVYLQTNRTLGSITGIFRLDKIPYFSGNYDYKAVAELSTLNGAEIYKLFVPSNTFSNSGTVIFGLLFEREPLDVLNREKRETSVTSNSTSERGSHVTETDESGYSNGASHNIDYGFYTTTDGCVTWDPEEEAWDSTSCKISKYSTPYQTLCSCYNPPGNSFASSFYVPPNIIDFGTVFSKFDVSNASVYGAVIATLIIFGLIAIWSRRKDNHDKVKWKYGFLKDNKINENCMYLISVETGLRKHSGCKSTISFILSGEDGDTGARILGDGERYFESGSVMNFICKTNTSLGKLLYMRVWNDNSGENHWASWYLVKIIVEDLHTRESYVFVVNNWLSIDKGDGMLERVVPVASSTELMTFNKLFSEHRQATLTDSHIWLSVFVRPQRSSFTRVQRLFCCLVLLFLTMISNAMFFKSEETVNDQETVKSEIQIGIFRLSLSVLFTSVISLVITLPPTLLIIYLFRLSRPYGHKTSSSRNCCGKYKSRKLADSTDADSLHLTKLHQDDKPDAPQPKQETGNVNIKLPKYPLTDPITPGYISAHNKQESEQIIEERFITPNKQLPLPYWCVYIAYTLVVTSVLASSFFLILYSMQWGTSVSEEWLTAFLLGFIENVFMVDPFKILIIAVLYAICSKNPYTSPMVVDVETAKQAATMVAKHSIVERLPKPTPKPVTGDEIQKLQNKRLETLQAENTFIQLVLYLVFLLCLVFVSVSNRDSRTYIYQHHIDRTVFIDSFDQIKTKEEFFVWTNSTLIPVIFPHQLYNGKPLTWQEKLLYSDMANFRVGPVRIRQVRSKERPAPFYGLKYLPLTDEDHSYYWQYSPIKQEDSDYCLGWKHKPCPENEEFLTVSSEAWKYHNGGDIGLSNTGQLNSYDNTGFSVDISVNYDISLKKLKELYSNNWLDRQTRAVFTDFTLYNINTNLVLTIKLIAEFPEFGSVFVWRRIDVMRLFQYFGGMGVLNIICKAILGIIMIVFTIKCVRKLTKLKCEFLKNFWNIVDTITIVLSIICVTFYVLRKVYSDKALAKFREDPKKFVDFSQIVTWDDTFVCSLSFLVFITIIGLLKLLGYNKRLVMIGSVLKHSAKDLSSMGIIFGITISAYILFGYVVLHTERSEYLSIFKSALNTMIYLLGKNKLGRIMLDYSTYPLHSVYFMFLVFYVIFILMTMFQAILNASMTVIKSDLNQVPPPYGLTNVLKNLYQTFIGDWLPTSYRNKQQETRAYSTECCQKDEAADVLQSLNDELKAMAGIQENTASFTRIKKENKLIFQ